MDCTLLSNAQLYAIANNKDMAEDIRDLVSLELNNRNISQAEMAEIVAGYARLSGEKKDIKQKSFLSQLVRISIWLIPFKAWAYFWSELQTKSVRKRRIAIFYICSFFLLLTIAVVLWAKFYLFKQSL